MKKTEKDKAFEEIIAKQDVNNFKATLNRASSVTVGTSFGGTTEIMVRGADGNVLWTPMQPVEVVELIHQLAANIGCHINLQPRNDFASWRNWNYTPEELEHYRGVQPLPGVGHAPHVNDMAPHMQVGREYQPVPHLENNLVEKKETVNAETVATKKTVNKRNSKRTTDST